MFRSLKNHNYRLWASGAFVSNVGTWMQRIAQDWLVLTILTANSASAVGIVMALQFGPQAVLFPLTGFAADYFDRRKMLMTTQFLMGILALGLGALTLSGNVELWHVYTFALLLGCVTAFDSPARQAFVSDMVQEQDLANAVALNSTSFNAARMIGPAIAGGLIAAVGCGWVFLINAISFVAVLTSLFYLRLHELIKHEPIIRKKGSLVEGLRYVWQRPDLRTASMMLFLVTTFGLNFPIFISTMTVKVFKIGSEHFGALMSMMAIGSVIGALLAARRERPHLGLLLSGAGFFAVGCTFAALMPSYLWFGFTLIFIGIAAQTFTTSANSLMQLSVESAMRGRVIAIFLLIMQGGTLIGAPVIGWVADDFGPRWSLGVAAFSGVLALFIGVYYLVKYKDFNFSEFLNISRTKP
ncbi:MFS transporter [Acinetobacter baumannii]